MWQRVCEARMFISDSMIVKSKVSRVKTCIGPFGYHFKLNNCIISSLPLKNYRFLSYVDIEKLAQSN